MPWASWRLAKKYGEARLEAACGKSLAVGARSYRHVEGVLKHGLDRVDRDDDDDARPPVDHPNIRGGDYYHWTLNTKTNPNPNQGEDMLDEPTYETTDLDAPAAAWPTLGSPNKKTRISGA